MLSEEQTKELIKEFEDTTFGYITPSQREAYLRGIYKGIELCQKT